MTPGPEFYKGLSLADAFARLAEHHADQDTRHMSSFEYQLLLLASEALKADEPRVID